MDAILHEAWVLFVGIGSWFVNRLSSKLDDLDKNKADAEQMEMIGEQGMTVYQAHIQTVKTNNPKTV